MMELKSTRPVSLAEAREIMGKRKEGSELGYEQAQALENLDKFGSENSDKARTLVTKLVDENKISTDTAVKLVDIRPAGIPTLKAVLVKDKVELTEEQMNEIIKELQELA